MANYLNDNEDLLYYFDKGIDWNPLIEVTERGFTDEDGPADAKEALETYRDIAEMVGKFCADEIAPRAEAIDRKGVHLGEDGEAVMCDELQEIFSQIKDLDLHWLTVPRELGGMNAPLLLYFINSELMARADVSVMAHHGFHGGMAMAMLVFSIREGTTTFENNRIVQTRFREQLEEIARGNAWGCMDITEPDAGSDMARLRAVGEQDEDGNWFVTGQKIFITSGHGKYHFVIARTEKNTDENDPFAGLGGLSFFMVPTYEEDESGKRTRLVTLDRVEEKLGHHGSCTAALSFDRAPAHLIGKRGEGFKYMLTLMNNARVGVGFECVGICEAAYRLAKAYAEERPSMGKTIDRHEMIADYLEEMQTDVQGLRALAMRAGWEEEMAQKLELLVEKGSSAEADKLSARRRIKKHKARSRRFTPLLKYLGAEKAVEISRRCLQIHGGNGYMREYGAEKLLRDAMVMPIYEGTSQIQALMAMKDTLLGVMKAPQAFAKKAAQARWRARTSRDPLERRVAKINVTSSQAVQHLLRRIATDKVKSLSGKPVSSWADSFLKEWDPKRDFSYAMVHAERLTQILVDEAIAEVLLSQAKKHPERREVLERWLDRAEARDRGLLDQIVNTGEGLLRRLARSSGEDVGAMPAAAAE